MADAHKNFAYSQVATAPAPATSGTSLLVSTGEGALFPTPPFNATVWPSGSYPTAANAEIVRVTAIATDTLTITRTQESTSARTIVAGDQISATITVKTLTDVEGVTGGQILVTKTVAATGGDYTTLSAAVAAASAGWTIHVNAGTYTEAGITGLALANISIVARNPEGTVLNFGANSFTTAAGADYLHIEGMKFTFSTGKLSFASCANLEVVGCHIYKTGNGLGFEAQASCTNMLYANNVYNSTSIDTAAVSFSVSANYGRIIGSSFKANATFTNRGHIEITGNSIYVTDNTFEYNGTGTEYLIKFLAFYGIFSNNTIVQNSAALLANLFITGDFITVTSCTMVSAGNVGILVQGGEATITGCTIQTNITAASSAIKINGSTNLCAITGNHIRGASGGVGVSVSAATNCSITSNTFVTCGTDVSIAAASTDVVLTGNSFNGFATDGVNTAALRTVITGNKFSCTNTAANGVTIDAGDCVVSGNHLKGGSSVGTGLGISIANTVANDDNIITGNRVSGFLTGIKVIGANSDRTLLTSNNTQGNGTGLTDAGTTSTVASNV